MEEIEVKILEVNRAAVGKTLANLGAKKVFDGDIQTFFFNSKEGTIIKQKDVLRLRKEQDVTELTYKKVHVTQTAKTAEEYTVVVSSFETAKTILENLGLSVIESLQKHRVSYTLGDARFDFDQYRGDHSNIPEFMEIEAKSTDSIYKYAEVLGFEAKDCLPWSTTDLIKHYANKKTDP
jgi:predicted adenylyl cyclase CyaB